jgi:tRNA threonylcarbamoyladenosine biosynthesis protein TsaE
LKLGILFLSLNPQQTKKISKLLAQNLRGGEVFGLIGDLGGGKTTFVQGVAAGLGVKEKIKSPTFVILKKYKISKHKSIKHLYHIDLYRLFRFSPVGKNLDILGFDLKEIIKKDSVIFIEWAEKIAPILPKNWIKIEFKYIDKNRRKIVINSRVKTQISHASRDDAQRQKPQLKT